MKKLFTLFAMLACVAVASAQHRLVATLSHNDTVSVYYGKSAFYYAYNASVDGDVITLSSGVFDATSIEKSITIRGAGMEQDTVNNIAPTILSSSGYCWIRESPILEGIRINHEFRVESQKCFRGKFTKCIINRVSSYSNDNYTNMWEAEFIQCKIEGLSVDGKATVINSYVGSLSDGDISELSMTNCVVGTYKWEHIGNTIFTNSILLDSESYTYLPVSNMAYNCISIGKNVFTDLLVNTNNTQVDAAFKDTGFYELIDSVKTKYLGTDGTEVGIYGGPAPFNPTKTSYPRIEKFSVSQMNENGEVKVDVEVSTIEE